MAKERALDVFELLGKLDRKDYEIWDALTDEQKKEFSPLVVMRWMAGCSDPVQIIFLNEIVNTSVFQLGDHKELLMKLLAVCSNGKSKRYSWINYKVSSGTKKSKKVNDLIAAHYHMSLKEADEARKLFSDAEIIELAEMHGLQKEEINEIKKELK